MLIIILIFSIILIAIGIWCNHVVYDDVEITISKYIGGFILSTSILIILGGSAMVSQESSINEQLSYYNQINEQIEVDIQFIIDEYVEDHYNGNKKTDSTNIIIELQVYSSLKSNEGVANLLKIYTNNKAQIEELRNKKLEINTWKWWLYFG